MRALRAGLVGQPATVVSALTANRCSCTFMLSHEGLSRVPDRSE